MVAVYYTRHFVYQYPVKAVLIKYTTVSCSSWYFLTRHFLFEIIAQKYDWWLQAIHFFEVHIITSNIWGKELKNINLSLSLSSLFPLLSSPHSLFLFLSLSLHKSNLKIRVDRNIYFPPYGTKNSELHKIHIAVESWIIIIIDIRSWQIWHFAIST